MAFERTARPTLDSDPAQPQSRDDSSVGGSRLVSGSAADIDRILAGARRSLEWDPTSSPHVDAQAGGRTTQSTVDRAEIAAALANTRVWALRLQQANAQLTAIQTIPSDAVRQQQLITILASLDDDSVAAYVKDVVKRFGQQMDPAPFQELVAARDLLLINIQVIRKGNAGPLKLPRALVWVENVALLAQKSTPIGPMATAPSRGVAVDAVTENLDFVAVELDAVGRLVQLQRGGQAASHRAAASSAVHVAKQVVASLQMSDAEKHVLLSRVVGLLEHARALERKVASAPAAIASSVSMESLTYDLEQLKAVLK